MKLNSPLIAIPAIWCPRASAFHSPVSITPPMVLFTVLSAWQMGIAEDNTPVPIRCAKVMERSGSVAKSFVGNVEPARRSLIGAAVAGRVESVFVEPGDFVEDTRELVQLRLRAVQIRVEAAKANLEVHRQQMAELIAGPRAEEIRRLEALVKGADAVLKYATKKFDRLESLIERRATPQGTLDEALSIKIAAEQKHIAAKAEHEAALAGATREQLAQATARVASAEEELNRVEDEFKEHTILAPFSGYVSKRLVERGEWLQVGEPIAEIIELDPAEIRVSVPEEYISRVTQDQQVRIDVAAIKADSSDVLMGNVFRVVPDAESRSRSFPVRVRIKNPLHKGLPLLKPGMLAKVFLPVGPTEKMLVVPQDALVLDRDRAFIFVVDSGESRTTVRRVQVEPGALQDSMIEIKPVRTAGISLNTYVVIEGNERLRTGQSVSVLQ